jgi:hypothetical protein
MNQTENPDIRMRLGIDLIAIDIVTIGFAVLIIEYCGIGAAGNAV